MSEFGASKQKSVGVKGKKNCNFIAVYSTVAHSTLL